MHSAAKSVQIQVQALQVNLLPHHQADQQHRQADQPKTALRQVVAQQAIARYHAVEDKETIRFIIKIAAIKKNHFIAAIFY